MATGGEKKISFSFSKSIKKPIINKSTPKETKHDFIECLDDKAIKVLGGVEKKNEPLVIPMLGSKTWHERILHKVNADIFEPKTEPTTNGDLNNVKVKQEVIEDASGGTVETFPSGPEPMELVTVKEERPEEPATTLEEQAAQEILRDLQMQGERTEQTNIPVVPLPEDESLIGKKESTLDDYEQVPIDKYGEAMLRGMGWQPGKGIGKNENMAQRTPTEISRILREHTERVNYLDEESEDEIDFIPEKSNESSEYSSFYESDDGNEAELEIHKNDASRKKKFLYGDKKHNWATELPDPLGQSSRPVDYIPRRKGDTPCENPYEFWHLLFTDAMLDLVVQYTNAEIENYRVSNESAYPPAQSANVTKIEIQAYIGLLYFGGYQRQSDVAVDELWSNEFGSNFYKSTMTEMRFKFISSKLRFDDKNTRNFRRETDPLAPIRELWDSFIGNCQANYIASDSLIIDEQLLDFRGKFSARVYQKSKPAKCGIKIVILNDAKTFYLYNAIPYIGGESVEFGESISDYYVRNLCQPIYGTKRHIVKDEFNLSMPGMAGRNKTAKRKKCNQTKSESGVFDFSCRSFSCARKTRRWTTRLFMGILDQAGVNACILYTFQFENSVKDRRQFLRELILELVTPQMRTRLMTANLPRSLLYNIRFILKEPEQKMNLSDKLEKRKRCAICDPKKDRKTKQCCVQCRLAVCEEHRYTCCRDCL
ncbi:uncharacterized protein LOC117177872 isoform X1 [Belonocnema kinseyi]|uniref:uncharacterized protein LOC117177872 isoform X1 n=1 Tax=Belonocnema kinseyi TaxID=2817044 RepID=UPI00143D3167|nr:uncharacterized protein LOC117177872 isoform X1 [Belonocnema kinseyi]